MIRRCLRRLWRRYLLASGGGCWRDRYIRCAVCGVPSPYGLYIPPTILIRCGHSMAAHLGHRYRIPTIPRKRPPPLPPRAS